MKTFAVLSLLLFISACSSDMETIEYDLQGHRGARGLVPENTIPSFLKAIDLGVDTIEMDLVVTGDGQLLVSHEPWFSHLISTKPDGNPVDEEEEREFNIFEMTLGQTQQFDVGKRGNVNFPEQQAMEVSKPLFREAVLAIETYAEKNGISPLQYNIETKSQPDWYGVFCPLPEQFSQLLHNELLALNIRDRSIVQSFDPATLIEMKQIDPGVRLSMLVYEEFQSIERMSEILGFTPDIWSPAYRLVTPGLVSNLAELDVKLIPWTINDPDQMVRLLEMGVDGIITDYPDRAP